MESQKRCKSLPTKRVQMIPSELMGEEGDFKISVPLVDSLLAPIGFGEEYYRPTADNGKSFIICGIIGRTLYMQGYVSPSAFKDSHLECLALEVPESTDLDGLLRLILLSDEVYKEGFSDGEEGMLEILHPMQTSR